MMKAMMRAGSILVLGGALALAACERNAPEAAEPTNDIVEVPVETPPVNEVAAPETNVANEAAPAAPAPEFTDEEQMQDDADATGLTARLPDETGEPVDETQPVK